MADSMSDANLATAPDKMTDFPNPVNAEPGMSMSHFLVSSVHDMKNSLAVMADFLETALAQAADPATPLYRQASQALYETRRINDHLIQLLALYKIEQDFYPFDPREQNLADLALDALSRVANLAQARGISLEYECPDDLHAWFDYELIVGVLVQALHNALHYARDRVLCLIAADPRGGISIRVEDNGPGFPDFLLRQGASHQREISFETGSTGLGLYFASVVAGLHRGGERNGSTRLENEGSLGGGCFVLELP